MDKEEINKPKKKIFFDIISLIYIIGVIGFTLFGPKPYYVRCSRGSARDKACYSNIRVIQGAVEMYNMDSSIMMDNLDIDILKDGRYLKEKPVLPEVSCAYFGNDLSKDGYVYCGYHGDLQGYKHDYSKGPLLTEAEKLREKINKFIGDCFEKLPYAIFWPLFAMIIIGQICGLPFLR